MSTGERGKNLGNSLLNDTYGLLSNDSLADDSFANLALSEALCLELLIISCPVFFS